MSSPISAITELVVSISFISGVGPKTIAKLTQNPKFAETNLEDMGQIMPNLASKLTAQAVDSSLEKLRENIDAAKKDGARIISFLDDEYPELLRKTPDSPSFLFVKGVLQHNRTVGVIGTRQPTLHGTEITKRLTHYLCEKDWSIISGLALGVDSIAHQAALDAGGHTVAVLAHGLQTIAPKQHTALANAIVEQGGALVTEYPYGTPVFPAQYVKRDRIQAGLSQGVVMVQSDIQGGSLHASRASIEYGRPLGVPQPTPRDLAAREEKIQGNLAILGEPAQAAKLLRCRESALQQVVALRSKDDYPLLEAAMLTKAGAKGQASLF